MTITEDIATAEGVLARAGIETALHDAEWIAARALNRGRGDLLAHGDEELSPASYEHFHDMVERRAAREPLGYVLGSVSFRGLELEVGAGCLVPRPETEITAERAIAHARKRSQRPTVVDVGAGCGAIAIAIAAEVPNARIFATERSAAARGWALRNLARTGLRCTLLPGSLMEPLHPALGGGVDVLVSNPPYVPEHEWGTLEPEIQRYEPKEAIIGGPTGFEIIHELVEHARTWLAVGGWLVVECSSEQTEKLSNLLLYLGYADVSVTKDLAGRPRVVEARWVG